jgi:hypothetical protein
MVDAHTTDVLTDSIVRVNGTRIPVGDVDVFMRNEGPLDFTRYAEGEFPSPFKGVDYADAFSGFDPTNQDEWDVVTIDVKDYVTDDYYRAFTGVVTGVGNASDGGERWMKFRAQGPGHFVDKIPASYKASNVSVRDILSYVSDELNQHLPIEISDPKTTQEEVRSGTTVESPPTLPSVPSTWVTSRLSQFMSLSDEYNTEKSWIFGKHTLSDVIDWASSESDFYIWLAHTRSGVGLAAFSNPISTHHDAQYLGGDLKIENNDALSELRPVNTMLVKAPAKDSRDGEDKKASKKYVKAKAIHEPLYRRAGNTYLYADVHNISGAKTKVETQNEAKNQLKEAINQTTAGDMQTWLRGPVTPFDTVEAKPTCDGSEATNIESLTYEVTRVHHKIRASEPSSTVLNVGVHTDPEEDIVVEDGWEDA